MHFLAVVMSILYLMESLGGNHFSESASALFQAWVIRAGQTAGMDEAAFVEQVCAEVFVWHVF